MGASRELGPLTGGGEPLAGTGAASQGPGRRLAVPGRRPWVTRGQAELRPRHCRPLSQARSGARGGDSARLQLAIARLSAHLGHETQRSSRHKEINVGPGLETRHELLPGLVSSLTSSSPINLAQTRLTAFLTRWITSLGPTTAGWPSLMPVTLPPSVGASTVASPHRRPII